MKGVACTIKYWDIIYIYIVVLNIINCNFGLIKSWQKSPRPIGASVLFVPFWSHSKPHTKAQLERPKRLAQLDNQWLGEKHTEFFEQQQDTWIGMHVSARRSFILPWKIDWDTTLLGHKWNWSENWKCSQELLIFDFEIHHTKVHSLILEFWNLHSIFYQLQMK